MLTNTKSEIEEIRVRAAAIRRNWSATEKDHRKGLPPDVPAMLRNFILAPRTTAWGTKFHA